MNLNGSGVHALCVCVCVFDSAGYMMSKECENEDQRSLQAQSQDVGGMEREMERAGVYIKPVRPINWRENNLEIRKRLYDEEKDIGELMQGGRIRRERKVGNRNTFRTSLKRNILSLGMEQCYCAWYFPLPSFSFASRVYCCSRILQGGDPSQRDLSRLVKNPHWLINTEYGWIRKLNHLWLLMPQPPDWRSPHYFPA